MKQVYRSLGFLLFLGAAPILAQQIQSGSTDVSGVVASGNNYQVAVAASNQRKGCLIQNPTTATEVLNVKVGTMSAPYTLAAGSSFSCGGPAGLVVVDDIDVSAATTNHAFVGVRQ